MATDQETGGHTPREPDPDESPFELAPIAGIPFGKDSEEALAIRALIEEAKREQASD